MSDQSINQHKVENLDKDGLKIRVFLPGGNSSARKSTSSLKSPKSSFLRRNRRFPHSPKRVPRAKVPNHYPSSPSNISQGQQSEKPFPPTSIFKIPLNPRSMNLSATNHSNQPSSTAQNTSDQFLFGAIGKNLFKRPVSIMPTKPEQTIHKVPDIINAYNIQRNHMLRTFNQHQANIRHHFDIIETLLHQNCNLMTERIKLLDEMSHLRKAAIQVKRLKMI